MMMCTTYLSYLYMSVETAIFSLAKTDQSTATVEC